MSENIQLKLEALLFVASKPLSVTAIAHFLKIDKKIAAEHIQILKNKFNNQNSGIRIVSQGVNVQMVSAAEASELIREYFKEEVTGELTRPQLETLSIIAYRGPITKPQIEEIRGVNCSLILRILLIRGLVEEMNGDDLEFPKFIVTVDFLRHIGVNAPQELSDYKKFQNAQ
jgi:segregation and condensation protein B